MPVRTATRKSARPRKSSGRAKWVYLFAGGKAEGSAKMRDLLGGKGAGLAEMTNAKLPVPPGFTITTAACNAYFAGGKKLPPGLWEQVETVDPKRLTELIESRRLPPDVEDALLASREEVRTQHALYLRGPARSRGDGLNSSS